MDGKGLIFDDSECKHFHCDNYHLCDGPADGGMGGLEGRDEEEIGGLLLTESEVAKV